MDTGLTVHSANDIAYGVPPNLGPEVCQAFLQLRRTEMKRTGFTDEQIVAALREAETTSMGSAACKHGFDEKSLHRCCCIACWIDTSFAIGK